jgi:hypothetical protein
MAEINAGVNKQEIKNPVTSSNCYEQLEINEVLLNNALNGVSAPDKANKTGCNSYDMNSISFSIICKALLSPTGKKLLLKPLGELVMWFAVFMLLAWGVKS